jgi:hypothetical protein
MRNGMSCALLRQKEGREKEAMAGILDSQSVKTTQEAETKGYDAGKKIKGRKRHLRVDTLRAHPARANEDPRVRRVGPGAAGGGRVRGRGAAGRHRVVLRHGAARERGVRARGARGAGRVVARRAVPAARAVHDVLGAAWGAHPAAAGHHPGHGSHRRRRVSGRAGHGARGRAGPVGSVLPRHGGSRPAARDGPARGQRGAGAAGGGAGPWC